MDFSKAARELHLDIGEYMVLVKKFVEKIPQYRDSIFTAKGSGDVKKLASEAHKLKGVALNLRFQELAECAKTIEKMAKGELTNDDTVFEMLIVKLNDIEESVRKFS